MEAMWVLGRAFDVVDWLSIGYGRVVDIEGNLRIWRGDRRLSWYILGVPAGLLQFLDARCWSHLTHLDGSPQTSEE